VWLRYLVERDMLWLNPFPSIPIKLPHVRCRRGVFRSDEIERMLAVLDTDDWYDRRERALIAILYGAGLRRQEALNLDLADYDPDEQLLWVRQGKGGKGRLLPLGQKACRDIEIYLERGRPFLAQKDSCTALFVGREGRRLGPRRLLQRVQQIEKRAKVFPIRGTHAFRHAFATSMLAAGADVRYLQEFLGHVRLATTAHYTAVDLEDLRQLLRRFHPRERGG
jgi:site-specific recombinase XerD